MLLHRAGSDDAVFVPGGHGPMIDLLDDPNAGIVMRHFHETSKPTAVLCHGPISLLSALPNSTEVVAALSAGDAAGAHAKAQGWIYSGYKMTIFSTAEEQQREPQEIGGKVLFYPDFASSTAGGNVSVLAPWTSYVIQDRELISGQNPLKRYLRGSTSTNGAALPFTQMVSPKNSCIHMGCVPFFAGGYNTERSTANLRSWIIERDFFVGSAGKVERVFFPITNEVQAGQSRINIQTSDPEGVIVIPEGLSRLLVG